MLSIQNFISNKYYLFKLVLLAIGLGICILIYIPGISGDFVLDDFPNIVQNEKLHIHDLDFNSILAASFSSESGPLMRPVSMFTFALNYYISELNPLSYKLFNLAIHLLVGLSLFWLCRLLIDSYERLSNKKVNPNRCFYIPLIITVVWLVSPINLTAVLYIVQRMTSLSALFSILGLCFYIVARRSMIFKEKLNFLFFLLSGFSFIVAIFCKENGALSIFYLICIEVCLLQFISNSNIPTKTFRRIFLTLTITPIALIVVWILYDPSYILSGYDHRSFSLSERVLTQTRVLLYYLKWIVAPNITELGLYHDDLPISESILEPFSTLVSAVSILFLLSGSIVLIKFKPLVSFGILFFFSSHILESSVVNLEMMFEHRNYLASFGIIFSVITLIFYSITKLSTKKLAMAILCLWFCALATTTGIRASQWKDANTQAFYEASHHPESARANIDLARVYAELSSSSILDKKDNAIRSFEKSMELMPYEIAAETSAIIFCGNMNIRSKPKWKKSIKKKLGTFPITHITTESLKAINQCLLSSSCYFKTNEVLDLYEIALNNSKPYPIQFKSGLLSLYSQFSINQLNDYEIAYNAMKNAIEITPNELQFRINLIMLLIIMNKYDEAAFHIDFVESSDTFNLYLNTTEALKKDLDYYIKNTN